MLLEKSENFTELSIKHLIIQYWLASFISLGQAMWMAMWYTKNQMLMLFVAKLRIFVFKKSYPNLSLT